MKGLIMTTINKNKEELLKKLKQRLENSWSGVTQAIEELEEFEQDTQDNLNEKLSNFYLYNLEDLKYDSQDLQYKIFSMLNLFEKEFDIKEKV
jgi:hypothetical protein